MQKSTASLSPNCSRGSKVSFTTANLVTGVVDIALSLSAIRIDLGFPCMQRRRAVVCSDCHLVAVLKTPREGFKLHVAKGRATHLEIIVGYELVKGQW